MMQDAASARVVQKSQKTETTYCAAHPPVGTSGGIHSWQSYTHFASPTTRTRHYKICWRHHLERGYIIQACGIINQIQRSIRRSCSYCFDSNSGLAGARSSTEDLARNGHVFKTRITIGQVHRILCHQTLGQVTNGK